MAQRKSTGKRKRGQRLTPDPLRPRINIIRRKSAKRRKQSPLVKAAKREARSLFRAAVAKLKRKGLIPKSVDARKAKKTAALSRAVNKFRDVSEGQATAYKLPKDFPKEALRALKEQGYRVQKGRLILPQGQYFRKPSKKRQAEGATGIRTKPQSNRPGGEVITIKLGPDFEQQIREVFAAKKPGEWIGFQIYGNNSLEIYDNAQAMISRLSAYKGAEDGSIKYITIFKTTDPDTYLRERTNDIRKARRNLRARERKAMKRGMRVSRGH